MVLHGFTSWISTAEQILDGPPGDIAPRLSSFLLISVGYHRQGCACVGLGRLQKTLFADARDAPVGHQVEVLALRLNRGQPHPLTAFDAGHLNGGLKTRAGRRRPGYSQHRILEFQRGTQRYPLGPRAQFALCPIPDAIGTRKVPRRLSQTAPTGRTSAATVRQRSAGTLSGSRAMPRTSRLSFANHNWLESSIRRQARFSRGPCRIRRS